MRQESFRGRRLPALVGPPPGVAPNGVVAAPVTASAQLLENADQRQLLAGRLGRVRFQQFTERRRPLPELRSRGRKRTLSWAIRFGAIARALRRPKSTISRELSRNRLPSGRYSPLRAGAYQLRRRREALIEKDRALRSFVLDRLAEGWTPEQIAGWLKAGNERRLRAVGCETIYAFIYRAAQKAEQLWRYLTRRHKRRRPRRSRPSRDTIKDRVSIHERPENIDARTEAGHWEGDLIICKRTRPVLVLHERKSRMTLAARLVGKTAAETISVMLAVFARIEPTLRKSITFDNDTAFAQHARLKTMCAMTTWFCDAYASWQKGGVENANGRLRRWLPRQIDIDKVSDEEIQDIILTAISRRENASVSRRHSRRSSKSLAKTCRSGFHRPIAPRSGIHDRYPGDRVCEAQGEGSVARGRTS